MFRTISSIYNNIVQRSPWDDAESDNDNIFTRKKNTNFNWPNNFNFKPNMALLILVPLFLLWILSGIFYKVDEGQQVFVFRLGKFNRIGVAGLNYRLPAPIEEVIIENVDHSRRIEIGYRSSGKVLVTPNMVSADDIKSESIMLTGDENIVSLNVDVNWHIADLPKYILNLATPQETVKSAAESAIREVVGNTPISAILSNKKQMIAEKIEKLIQDILDHYESGVVIEQVKLLRAEPPEEVIASYRDVQTAKADKEKIINESEAYKNDILPKARGEAARILEEANAYKVEIIARAKGDVSRFQALYSQYLNNREVTRNRLYLETIEAILQNTNNSVIGTNNVLPHTSLDQQEIKK
jgi:membrane protease subunit HflK